MEDSMIEQPETWDTSVRPECPVCGAEEELYCNKAKHLAAVCKCGHPRDQHEEEDDHSYCLGDVHLTSMGTDYCSCREYRAQEERSGDTQHE